MLCSRRTALPRRDEREWLMPRALLCITTLIIVLAVTALPAVEARPKDKTGANPREVAAETRPAEEAALVADSAEHPARLPIVQAPPTSGRCWRSTPMATTS